MAMAQAPHGFRSGHGTVVAQASADGRTALVTSRAESPLRLLRPRFPGTPSAAVCLVTFGGGLVDGDKVETDIEVGPGATLVAFTQSSTKVFRGSSCQRLRARVEGTFVFAPDPVAAFAGARYRQEIEVDLVGDGACVLLDGFTSGRPAFGDRWAMSALDLRTTIRHEGRDTVVDALRFDADDGSLAERAGRFEAFTTLIAVGHRARPVIQAIHREGVAPPTRELVVAASSPPRAEALGLPAAIVRVTSTSPARAIDAVRSRLRNLPDIDAVDPFASRY
jgi:urease accessory protein